MSTASTRVVRQMTPVANGRQTLAQATKSGKKLPSRVVMAGVAGVGKTTFAAQAPSPLFLLSPMETGLHTLIDSGLLPGIPNIEVFDWENLQSLLDELTDSEHEYKTVVVDSLDGVEKLANQFVCRQQFGGDWGEKGFSGFQRGYSIVASGPWKEFLSRLDKLREMKRVGIILLAHTTIVAFADPCAPDYNRYAPDMHKAAWNLTFSWADMVLFGRMDMVVTKEKGDKRPKGHGSGARTLYTTWDAAFDAKNRHNLPDQIDMGNSGPEAWGNFIKALNEAKLKEEVK